MKKNIFKTMAVTTSILLTVIFLIFMMSFAMWAPDASAFQFYSDATNDQGGCAQCHTGFRDNNNYLSLAEGMSWGDSLHNVHLNNTNITSVGGGCDNCHGGVGTAGRTVNPGSSAAAADSVNAIACVGCHGRLEDANNVIPSNGSGYGAGLRQHHFINGVGVCEGCHGDSNPAVFTPVGEDTMPPWYGSVTNDNTATNLEPCNAAGEEQLAGDTIGLDNDGDNAYDTADPDCAGAEDCFNGVDDDNDGLFDCDDPDCDGAQDGACNTGEPGICAAGTLTCMGSNPAMCVRDNDPVAELCDGIDNDCDGSIDEIDSNEILNLITWYYKSILGRCPEAEGAEYWTAEIERIVSLGIDIKEGRSSLILLSI
jgi:hypothetical protein